jgi:hypothetical protein
MDHTGRCQIIAGIMVDSRLSVQSHSYCTKEETEEKEREERGEEGRGEERKKKRKVLVEFLMTSFSSSLF